jgi:hypothetical protein
VQYHHRKNHPRIIKQSLEIEDRLRHQIELFGFENSHRVILRYSEPVVLSESKSTLSNLLQRLKKRLPELGYVAITGFNGVIFHQLVISTGGSAQESRKIESILAKWEGSIEIHDFTEGNKDPVIQELANSFARTACEISDRNLNDINTKSKLFHSTKVKAA